MRVNRGPGAAKRRRQRLGQKRRGAMPGSGNALTKTRRPRGMEPAWHGRSQERARRGRQAAAGALRTDNGLAPMVVRP